MAGTKPDTVTPLPRRQHIARALIALLFGIVVSLLLLELLLSLDPLGFSQFRDQKILFEHLRETPAGYGYEPGVYNLPYSKTTVTILDDGTRLVPDTNLEADKTLVVLGDSVTFGYQVGDADTLPNQIARQLPNVRVINAAMTSFNVANVLRQYHQFPDADYFIWLIIANDADPEFAPPFHQKLPTLSWTAIYLTNLPLIINERLNTISPHRNLDGYLAFASEMTRDPRVLAVGYDNQLTPITPGALKIAPYTQINSWSDPHPNPQGDLFLANEIVPLIRRQFGL
jgi:hypothetical protein